MKRLLWQLAGAALLLTRLACAAESIDHMEPPFWWAGMHDQRLQLMVHGAGIGKREPAISYPGVRVASVSHVANPDYLLIDLVIAPDAAPGQFDIAFRGAGKPLAWRYELRARAPGSAARQGFSSKDAIYLVMPDRFANGDPANDTVRGLADRADRGAPRGRHGGDIQGMIDHLDYIAAMGFTQLWPTPMVENDMPFASFHGYAATDHYRIDPRFGTNADYLRLVREARQRGIGVIQDVVLSHIGLNHWWMKDLPTPDWINYGAHFVPTHHHRVAMQDPYAAQEDKDNFTRGWFSAGMPDMNQSNPFVATYLIQNNIWWIENAGLSGLRIDTFGYSDPAFLTEYTRRITSEYPHINLVGEEWSKLPNVVSHWQAGKRNFDGYRAYMPSMMDFPLTEAMRTALSDKEPQAGFNEVYETLSQDYVYPDAGNLVLFEGNHDMARIFSLLHEDVAAWKMELVWLATMPRIPQFYYGTEIQMTSDLGHDDATYRHDFPGGWAGDKVNAFTGAGLDTQQRDAQVFVRKLFNWRKQQSVIHRGKTMHFGAEDDTYVYFRYDDMKKILVALNKSKQERDLPVARFREMLAGVKGGTDVLTGARFELDRTLKLAPRSAVILELDAAR